MPESFNYAHFTESLQHDNITKIVLLSEPLYFSLNKIKELKSRRMRRVEQVALTVEKGCGG